MTIRQESGRGQRAGRPRAAVIGAGISGLTAAYLLQRAYDVTLYEAADRLGGHAHTHEISGADGRLVALDSGFIVHNARTYPWLTRLFGELGVSTQETEMSMSVRCAGCGLEYAGSRGPRGLIPDARLLARPQYLAMLAAIPGFYRAARRLLAQPARVAAPGEEEISLGEFLRRGGYPRYFIAHFAVPLVSAVWSCPPAEALRYPARYLFEFLNHHGILQVARSPAWRTVTGGSARYVELIAKQLTTIEAGLPARQLRRIPGGAEIRDAAGRTRPFSRVVVATAPDLALALLAAPTAAEREVLGAFRYTASQVLLHTDASVLPRAAPARASWNYLLRDCAVDHGATDHGATDHRAAADGSVQVSYHLNRLQRLTEPDDYLVTLNDLDGVAPGRVLREMTYRHPVYDQRSVAAQRRLPGLNTPELAYAGAYHGWGFHEDGCRSGVQAARALGVPW